MRKQCPLAMAPHACLGPQGAHNAIGAHMQAQLGTTARAAFCAATGNPITASRGGTLAPNQVAAESAEIRG